jgi:hypothetical protein
MTDTQRFAFALDGIAHIVATETPTAGVGVMVEAKCGHRFLARLVTDERPDHLGYCCQAHEEGWTWKETT